MRKSIHPFNLKREENKLRMKTFLTLIAVILMLLPMDAWAKPNVKVAITAEKEITIVENSQTVVKRVTADTVESGQIIFYTLTVTNGGDEKAANVVLNNPLPDGTAYVGDTTVHIILALDDLDGDGNALGAGTSRATNSMNIGLRIDGNVEVDDVTDALYVQPARRHVGRDQRLDRSVPEGAERAGALGLREVATQRQRREPLS